MYTIVDVRRNKHIKEFEIYPQTKLIFRKSVFFSSEANGISLIPVF